MNGRCFFGALLVDVTATAVLGDASFRLSPEVLAIDDGTQTLDIIISAHPGTELLVGAMGFDFDDVSEAWAAIDPAEFAWVPDELNDPNQWFITSDLPDPVFVNFGVGSILVPDGVGLTLGALTVTPNTAGEYSLDMGINSVGSPLGQPLQVKGGDPSDITIVVPEPCSLGLLAMGVLAAARRR